MGIRPGTPSLREMGAVSAEPCRCHSCVGVWWVEIRDAVHPEVPRMVPAAESDPPFRSARAGAGLRFLGSQGFLSPGRAAHALCLCRDLIHHRSCPGPGLSPSLCCGETGSLGACGAGAQVCGLNPKSTVSLHWPLRVCKTPEAGSC